jgi:hypothetical protein
MLLVTSRKGIHDVLFEVQTSLHRWRLWLAGASPTESLHSVLISALCNNAPSPLLPHPLEMQGDERSKQLRI